MKKLIVASAVSVLSIGLLPATSFASSISNTGAGSFNSIYDNNTNQITVTCDSSTDVVNINGQNANSGTATVDDNTKGGAAVSGNATNLNNYVANLGVSCVPAQQTSTPPAGGQGGGSTTPTTPVVAGASTTLPNTGSSSVVTGAVAAVALGAATWYGVRRKVLSE